MWSSLLLKFGMFAATLGVVFWIGWTLPPSYSEHEPAAKPLGEQPVESSAQSGAGPAKAPSLVTIPPVQPSPAAAPTRAHKSLLDLNLATEQDFDALPGIGPKLAERIMKHRQSVGAFHSPDDLRMIKGIGKKKFERIRRFVTVTPDTRASGKGKKET